MVRKSSLKVCDFFCGAGGFSEGFRQNGFEIVFALDIWKPAVETFSLNHPTCKKCIQGDIRDIDTPKKIDSLVPDTDVIIGSPPCVSFSISNNAGNADKKEGLNLVKSFLRIVAWKKKRGKLKYWIMENVPNIRNHMKQSYTFKELDLPGGKKIALKLKFHTSDSSDYGAPQKRKRFLCGEFPEPKKTQSKHMTLNNVIKGFNRRGQTLTDPIYGFKINSTELTDHFYNTTLPAFNAKEIKRLKKDSGFYGKMSFPDKLDRPSRTVLATSGSVNREIIVLSTKKERVYRLPTIRELASIMTFPINYLFQADTETKKKRLVGNAVCPIVASSLAKAILVNEGIKIPRFSRPKGNMTNLKTNLNGMIPKKHKISNRKLSSNFRRHVDYLKYNGFRVELDNRESDFSNGRVIWSAKLHHSQGKDHMKHLTGTSESIKPLFENFGSHKKFIRKIEMEFSKTVPSAKDFQIQYCLVNKNKEYIGPVKALSRIKKLVNTHYPHSQFKDVLINLKKREKNSNLIFHGKRVEALKIPVQFVAAFYACQRVAELTKNV